MFILSPPKTGTNLRHPPPPQSLNDSFISFYCFPPFHPSVFFFRLYVALVALALASLPGLYSAAYRTVTPFLRSPLMRMFFLPYAYYCVVVFRFSFFFFFNFCLCFCFLFIFGYFIIYLLFLLCPLLATMSFAGYFLVRFLLSAFPAFFLRPCSRFDLVWFRLSCNHGGWILSGSVRVRDNKIHAIDS